MPRGNPAVKLAVTVDADVHAKVLDAAEAEGTSVSAWITAAARRALLVRDGPPRSRNGRQSTAR